MTKLKETFVNQVIKLSEYCDPFRSEWCMRRIISMKRKEDPCLLCMFSDKEDCLKRK